MFIVILVVAPVSKELSNAEVAAASYVEEIERYMKEYELNHDINPGYYSIEIIPGKTYKVEELDSIIGAGVERPTSGIVKIGNQKNVESAKVVMNGLGEYVLVNRVKQLVLMVKNL